MSDFRNKICRIKTEINSCSHGGCEAALQRAVLCGLRGDTDDFEFTSDHNKINHNGLNSCGYGLELGINFTNKNRYIDISLAKLDTNENLNPKKVTNLCEVKVISNKYNDKYGCLYRYFYKSIHAEDFHFLQTLSSGVKIATFYNEGQIIFDFIKMMATRQILKQPDAEIYQILAIQIDDGIIKDFDDCKKRLVEILCEWKKHVGVKKGATLSIYQGNNSRPPELILAFQCQLKTSIECRIENLGLDKNKRYIHILLDWQATDFCLP